MKLKQFFILLMALIVATMLLSLNPVLAEENVTVVWDASQPADEVVGYNLYLWGNLTKTVEGVEAIITVPDKTRNLVVWCTAFDAAGNESGRSNVVFSNWLDPVQVSETTPPAPPSGIAAAAIIPPAQ